MSPLLLVLLGLADWAVFWSGTHTFLVDAERATLFAAPGWFASDGQQVWRYRVRADSHRHPKGLEGEHWPASRWTVLEQAPLDGRQFKALTPVPSTPPPGDGHLHAEIAVLQFTGDAAAIQQTLRHYAPTGATTRSEVYRLQLPSGAREQDQAGGGAEAIDWLESRLPGLLDRCVRQPVGALTLERPGGRELRSLVLGAARERCAGDTRALELGEVLQTGGGMAWWASEPRTQTGVIDARPDRDLTQALLLIGAASEADALRPPACSDAVAWLWKGGQATALGPAASLDGARWLAPTDPLLQEALQTRFLPVTAGACTTPMRLGTREARPAAPTAHACRIDEDGRAWGGPGDLAGAASATLSGGRVIIDVEVVDPERDPEDGVHVWVGGDQRRAVHFKVRAGGVGVWGGRAVRERIKSIVRHSWSAGAGGYATRIELPASLVGDPPAIAVMIEDRDPGVEGDLGLWVGGHRVTPYALRPVACEVQ